MKELNQGDTYEEFIGDDGLPMEFTEGEEDTNSKITQIFGIDIKYVVFGGVGILVVIMFLLFFSLRKTDEPDTTDNVEEWAAYEGEIVTDEYVEPVTTDPNIDPMTGLPYDYDETVEEVDLSSLSTEEQLKLRKLGYTGDEIALALDNGFDVAGLIEHAESLHNEEAHDALVRMSDAASDEFKYILEYSYFGQPGYEFHSYNDGYWDTFTYSIESKVINADYVKCPTYGSQLQLKCRVAEDLEIFYVVSPERFADLPERGNIVLNVEYTVYGENVYVTNVYETDSLLESIDSSEISVDTIYAEAENETVSEE